MRSYPFGYTYGVMGHGLAHGPITPADLK
uniref:Uncharacterized protein n=1 Tax=Arundo donax TaxID=35708 RepID=A0A0A8ZHX4_ARUDO